eukprot:12986080-Heterocapsa_arctica.AAC.1
MRGWDASVPAAPEAREGGPTAQPAMVNPPRRTLNNEHRVLVNDKDTADDENIFFGIIDDNDVNEFDLPACVVNIEVDGEEEMARLSAAPLKARPSASSSSRQELPLKARPSASS